LHLMGHLPELFLHKAPKEVEAQNDQDIESGIDVEKGHDPRRLGAEKECHSPSQCDAGRRGK